LLARGKHAALDVPQAFEIELVEQRVDTCRDILYPIHQSEDAQILVDCQVSGNDTPSTATVSP